MILAKRLLACALFGILLAAFVAGLCGGGASPLLAQGIAEKIKCEKIEADRKAVKAQLGPINAQIENLEKLQKSANRSKDEQTKAEKDLAKATAQHKKLTAQLKELDKEADKAKCK
jgi:septal ring factor EnvC (AmiA/AmiB activator)